MSGRVFKLVGTYKYFPERQEWIGTIAKHEGKDLELLCVGCELTETEIGLWCANTITMMREQDRLDVQAPDMYDRAKAINRPH